MPRNSSCHGVARPIRSAAAEYLSKARRESGRRRPRNRGYTPQIRSLNMVLQFFPIEQIGPVAMETKFVERLHHPHFETGSAWNAGTQDLFAHMGAVAAERFGQPAGARDGIAVNAEIAQQFIGIAEAATGQGHVDHQLAIPGGLAIHVESAGLQKRLSPEEGRLLPEKTGFI